jgi:hypothetical protein
VDERDHLRLPLAGDAGQDALPGGVDSVALQDRDDEQYDQQQYPDVADERPDRGYDPCDQRDNVNASGCRLDEEVSDVLDEQDSNNSIQYLWPEDK